METNGCDRIEKNLLIKVFPANNKQWESSIKQASSQQT